MFNLSKAAIDLIGNPDAVELLYDPDTKTIGIRPAPRDTPHAYVIRGGPGAATSVVSASAFTRHYGLDTSVGRRYTPTVHDGTLCIDLRDPGTPVHSNRWG